MVWLSNYISNSLSKSNRGGLTLLSSFFLLMNTLASAALPPTPPINTSLFMSFCPFLIVCGSCSNSINSHSLWWLVPVHWWPGGRTVVCWRCSEVVLSCSVWTKRLKMWKAGSAVGHVWLYTLTAGDCWLLKLHTWMWETSDVLQQYKKHNESCLWSKKYKTVCLIINRYGLTADVIICVKYAPNGTGNRISTRVRILKICAQWWSINWGSACSLTGLGSNLLLSRVLLFFAFFFTVWQNSYVGMDQSFSTKARCVLHVQSTSPVNTPF